MSSLHNLQTQIILSTNLREFTAALENLKRDGDITLKTIETRNMILEKFSDLYIELTSHSLLANNHNQKSIDDDLSALLPFENRSSESHDQRQQQQEVNRPRLEVAVANAKILQEQADLVQVLNEAIFEWLLVLVDEEESARLRQRASGNLALNGATADRSTPHHYFMMEDGKISDTLILTLIGRMPTNEFAEFFLEETKQKANTNNKLGEESLLTFANVVDVYSNISSQVGHSITSLFDNRFQMTNTGASDSIFPVSPAIAIVLTEKLVHLIDLLADFTATSDNEQQLLRLHFNSLTALCVMLTNTANAVASFGCDDSMKNVLHILLVIFPCEKLHWAISEIGGFVGNCCLSAEGCQFLLKSSEFFDEMMKFIGRSDEQALDCCTVLLNNLTWKHLEARELMVEPGRKYLVPSQNLQDEPTYLDRGELWEKNDNDDDDEGHDATFGSPPRQLVEMNPIQIVLHRLLYHSGPGTDDSVGVNWLFGVLGNVAFHPEGRKKLRSYLLVVDDGKDGQDRFPVLSQLRKNILERIVTNLGRLYSEGVICNILHSEEECGEIGVEFYEKHHFPFCEFPREKNRVLKQVEDNPLEEVDEEDDNDSLLLSQSDKEEISSLIRQSCENDFTEIKQYTNRFFLSSFEKTLKVIDSDENDDFEWCLATMKKEM